MGVLAQVDRAEQADRHREEHRPEVGTERADDDPEHAETGISLGRAHSSKEKNWLSETSPKKSIVGESKETMIASW